MTTTVTLDAILTEDAAPPTSPYRVSKVAGKDSTTVIFHADASSAHLYPSPTLHPNSASIRPAATLHPAATLDPTDGPIPEPPAYVRGYRVRYGGSDPNTGVLLAKRGFCAGMICDPDAPCDNWLTLSGSPFRTGTAVTDSTIMAEALGAIADGAVTINVYAFTSSDGWSS